MALTKFRFKVTFENGDARYGVAFHIGTAIDLAIETANADKLDMADMVTHRAVVKVERLGLA